MPGAHNPGPLNGQSPEEKVLQKTDNIQRKGAGGVKVNGHLDNIIDDGSKFAEI